VASLNMESVMTYIRPLVIPCVMLGFAVLGRAASHGPHGRTLTLGGAIFLLSFTLFLSGVLMRRGLAALLKKYLAPFECALGPVA